MKRLRERLDAVAERQLKRRGAQRVEVDGQKLYVVTSQVRNVEPKKKRTT